MDTFENGLALARVIADKNSEIERLRVALEFIVEGYANQDVNHVDYRVKVYQVALAALGKEA